MARAKGRIIQKLPTGFPNVELILHANNPYWYVKIYDLTEKRNFIRSTNTADEAKAMRVLPEIYTAFLQSPDALKRQHKLTTCDLVDKWISHVDLRLKRREIEETTHGNKTFSMRKAILPYILDHNLLRITDINPKKDFKAYVDWRLDQGLKLSSVLNEVKHLKEWLTWCYKQNYIDSNDIIIHIPRQTSKKKYEDDESAKAFTNEMFEDIVIALSQKIKNSKGYEQLKWQQVFHFFSLMIDGGFRTDELYNMQWRDIKSKPIPLLNPDVPTLFENLCEVRVSKTGYRQTIIESPSFYLLREIYKSKGIDVSPTASLWPRPGTKRMWSKQLFTTRFRTILNELNIPKEFRLYSSRATYITDRIENGVSTYLIAKNIGTSETMIRKNYESVLMRLQTDELFKRKDRGEEPEFKSLE